MSTTTASSTQTLVIVSGASKGFGTACALAMQESFGKSTELFFVLTGRDHDGLKETQRLLTQAESSMAPDQIAIFVCDLSDSQCLDQNIDNIIKAASFNEKTWESVYLFNNHGSLGELDLTTAKDSALQTLPASTLLSYTALNYTSYLLLNIQTLNYFQNRSKKIVLVNTSSLMAIKAFAGHLLYCSLKSARDMANQVFEEDFKERSSQMACLCKTLNYAPGPMDTDMQLILRTKSPVESQRQFFETMKKEGKLIQPIASARKLSHLLFTDSFTSAQHVDYFDL